MVSETQLGDVRGSEGFFHYRQYSAIELARKRSLEDVWYLLFEGALPDYRQSRACKEELAELRQLDAEVAALLPGIAKVGEPWNPLDGLRTALSLACTARGLGGPATISPGAKAPGHSHPGRVLRRSSARGLWLAAPHVHLDVRH